MRHFFTQTIFLFVICAHAVAQTDKIDRSRIDRTFNDSLAGFLSRYSDCSNEVRQFSEQLEIRSDPSREYVFVTPLVTPDPQNETDRRFLVSIARLRKQFSQQLVKLAKTAVHSAPNFSFRLFHEAALHDPENRAAKAFTRNRIHSTINVNVKSGRTAYPEFGWAKNEYFIVNSSNYSIVSNANRDDVVQLAQNLERLSTAWRQVFFEHWSSKTQLSNAISRGGAPRMARERFSVVLFANEKDYLNVIRRFERRARITKGIYIPKTKTAYFHLSDSDELGSTWKHEATHQLFAETGLGSRNASLIDNFWVLEGLATYMESLQIRPGYSFVGGLEADRLQFARYRTLGGISELSLQELSAMSQRDLQKRADIPMVYSQAAGVTHFLIRNHRSAFMRYVKAVYSGRDSKRTLATATGLTFDQLGEEYKNFLMVEDDDLKAMDPRATIRNLSLACTNVTDKQVEQLALDNVQWFDLGLTAVTDDGLTRLDTAKNLTQLSLFHTQITDATVRRLANAMRLAEVDLSGTKITDASVPILISLPKLQSVEVDDTQLSARAIQKLKARFPNIE